MALGLPKLNNKMFIGIVVAVIVLVMLLQTSEPFVGMHPDDVDKYHRGSAIGTQCDDGTERVVDFGYDRHGFTRYSNIEGFVPWNSQNVGKYNVTLVRADQLVLEEVFKRMVESDKGKIDLGNTSEWRQQPVLREQSRTFINHILRRVNRLTDRRFHILDISALSKEAALDIRDNSIVNRYTAELFVQEKDPRKVHAHAMSIRMEMIVKNRVLQLTKLHFITDFFYKRPLVDGYNPFQKSSLSGGGSNQTFGTEYFRIKNPFNLVQPFFTSEDKVLPNGNTSEGLLADHHKDLREPKYRCFQSDPGAPVKEKSKELCDLSNGYWDTPVTRDEECPFFMKNKNFPNRLGGISPDGETCEMPVGTKRIGYRYISADPIHQPWCYNCNVGADGQPGSAGPCCTEQLNVELYPNLGGNPDYMYPGDALERGQHFRELAERGLNWRRNPTRIRDVTNPSQRQPVFNAIIGPGPGQIDVP